MYQEMGPINSVWDLTGSIVVWRVSRRELDEVVEAPADFVNCPATGNKTLPNSSRRFCTLPAWPAGVLSYWLTR